MTLIVIDIMVAQKDRVMEAMKEKMAYEYSVLLAWQLMRNGFIARRSNKQTKQTKPVVRLTAIDQFQGDWYNR